MTKRITFFRRLKRLFTLIIVINICSANGSKYCSYEVNGEPKYFVCARNEDCCNFGCCVHLAFQFYQLWYYWLLLIFMFMICSGGSWWYKFCRQNESSAYPSLPQAYERSTRQGMSEIRRTRGIDRVTLDTSSYYLQRMWKASNMAPPPNYYTASVVRYHSTSELETRRQQQHQQQLQDCPYYQLYGPPPSYESVINIPNAGYGQPICMLLPSTSDQPIDGTACVIRSNSSDNLSEVIMNSQENPIPSTSEDITSSNHPNYSVVAIGNFNTKATIETQNENNEDDEYEDEDDNGTRV